MDYMRKGMSLFHIKWKIPHVHLWISSSKEIIKTRKSFSCFNLKCNTIFVLENDWRLQWHRTKHIFEQNALASTFTATFSLHNHPDIINSSNTASLQQQWCLGAGVTCTQHYRISRYLTQTCCGVLTLIPGPLESPVCVTLSCLIPIISQPRR